MFLRTVKAAGGKGVQHEYVRLVESYRDNGRNKQRVVCNLGRKRLLAAHLDSLMCVRMPLQEVAAGGDRDHDARPRVRSDHSPHVLGEGLRAALARSSSRVVDPLRRTHQLGNVPAPDLVRASDLELRLGVVGARRGGGGSPHLDEIPGAVASARREHAAATDASR